MQKSRTVEISKWKFKANNKVEHQTLLNIRNIPVNVAAHCTRDITKGVILGGELVGC